MAKNTGKALLASVMSMVLCFAMLLGTTLAWFTDKAFNDMNRITTGIFDVQLLKYVDTGYVDISVGKGNIFNDGTVTEGENFATATLWEPNKTEVVLLQVKNNGNLALDYNINLVITPDASPKTESLSKVMQYAIISDFNAADYRNGAADGTAVVLNDILKNAGITSWKAITGYTGVETAELSSGQVKGAPIGALLPGACNSFLLAVHMDENAGNEYQDLGLTIEVNVEAKQQSNEADSFGTKYDENAPWWSERFLNCNLLKDSGFDAGLVNDSAKGWVLYDHDKDGDVTPKDNGTIQITEDGENKYLEISFKDYLTVTNGEVEATHECALDNNTKLKPHPVIPGVYQTVDLSKYSEVINNFEDYQFEISAKSRLDYAQAKLYIYFEYLDAQGTVLNNPAAKANYPGEQIYEYQANSLNNWEDVNTIVSGSKVPANTAKINVCFALRVKDTHHIKGLDFPLNLDDVQFIITQNATTE